MIVSPTARRGLAVLGTATALLLTLPGSARACTVIMADAPLPDVSITAEGCSSTIPLVGVTIVATTVVIALVSHGIATLARFTASSAADLAEVVALALPGLTTAPPPAAPGQSDTAARDRPTAVPGAGDSAGLLDYTGEGYRTLNPFLRSQSKYPAAERAALQARADRVSKGLAGLPPRPGTTYRGARLTDDLLARYEPGKVVTERGFTSTSRNLDVALEEFKGNVLMTVRGQNGRDVLPRSAHPHEAEILYDQGTRFRVISKTWDPDIAQWLISLREVPA